MSLLDNWINSFPIKQMDSLDNKKAGVGIISSELNAIYKAFTSEDGGLGTGTVAFKVSLLAQSLSPGLLTIMLLYSII